MNEPVSYLMFEERREAEEIESAISTMVAPTMQDAVDLFNE